MNRYGVDELEAVDNGSTTVLIMTGYTNATFVMTHDVWEKFIKQEAKKLGLIK